jgi:hypothetical protein
MFAGTVIDGGVVSTTVTVNEACAVLPRVSVAVQFTVVVPSGNVDPDAGVQLTGRGPSTRSVAVGLVYETAAPLAPVASFVMFAGTPEIVGGVVSTTITWNEAVDVLPLVSVAVQVTVVVPSGNVDPDAGVQLNVATATLSVAVAV